MKLLVGISVKLHRGDGTFYSLSECVCLTDGSDGSLHSPHLQEDLPELRAHLHQRVQVAAVRGHAQRLEVVRLELLLLPAATGRQRGRVSGLLSHHNFSQFM